MIERWYKAPVNGLFDVRIARMPAGLFRSWHQMLALASLNNGALPPVEQIAFKPPIDGGNGSQASASACRARPCGPVR